MSLFFLPLSASIPLRMNSYKKINNILGWVVFAIASAVYIITSEPTMSFWDCGEYISTAYKLEVGHPPGAPLFQLIGRFFSLFAFGDVTLVARMVNTMSALSSGFTILFLFWTITLIAKKIVVKSGGISRENLWIIMGAGLVGSLAYTFTDSFWFSAVEGEVYAMSSFFTAIVVWAIFKWEEQSEEKHAYRYLILIAYLVGLSIGVHLLNLLAIPAITFVYYFKKNPKPTWKGIVLTLILSVLILAFVMYLIIPWILKLAGLFELFFINTLGLPFNTGTIIYFALIIGFIIWGLIYTRKKSKPVWNTIILSFSFIVIGYSSFLMLVIRSNANPPIDENNPENAMYLLAYMNREQYGDWPLLTGQYYNAPVVDREDGNPVYAKDDKSGKYVVTDKREKVIPVYDKRFTTFFPRMWDQTESRFASEYIRWGNVKGRPVEVNMNGETETRNVPTFGENLAFFWNYQLVHMYYRYFMWNFAGRQNDIQGMGNKLEGNWKSGIGFIDRMRLGPEAPGSSRENKGNNSFYFLPLLLGIAGIFFTLKKDKQSAWVIFLLFFMTGLAIVLYLNQHSPQPRERDYAYAGSFYAFAIWIGLAIPQLVEWLGKFLSTRIALLISLVVGLSVVTLMAQQGWDDHDRSGRYTSLAIAENYLNSCEPNAILFTNGDNDTFPLWYAQEVEGIRTDVRVINLSLLNTEWFIDQMKRKAYLSDPVPFSLTKDKYRQGNHDVTYLFEDEALKNTYVDLKALFGILAQDDSRLKMNTSQVGTIDYFPTKKFMVTYDSAALVASGAITPQMMGRLDTIRWEYKDQAIEKANLMILDLLATNNWKRPVYFVSTTGADTYIGLDNYLHLEGLAYRLLPVKAISSDQQTGQVNTDVMYDNVMNRFKWGNMNKPGVYIDEANARMIMNMRGMFGRLADALILEGKKDSARRVVERCFEIMPESVAEYDFFTVSLVDPLYRIGETAKANALASKILKITDEKLMHMFSFPEKDLKPMDMNIQEGIFAIQRIGLAVKNANQKALIDQAEPLMKKYYDLYVEKIYQQ
ncbi:MAG: DUF2723 domain-containing protein [Alphaproteobacteria bacterium]|nr:DUF2723 domain-containing protein [Alphaproteobacteria bacterium]